MAFVIHPPLTHYPIALFTVGSVVYLYGELMKKDDQLDKAIFIILIGLVMALFTGLAGIIDATNARLTFNFPILQYHITMAITTIILYSVGYISHRRDHREIAMFIFILGFITSLAIGYFGGEMVYSYGVNVG